ncbi:MAG: DedA family protein [Gammaproteobacteria bacterium]|nr:DedA family protein [Gammaproteobacteria bacterium]
MIDTLLDWFRQNPEFIGIGIAIIACVESFFIAGIIVPGVALLFGASALAGSLGLAPVPLLLWGAGGAIVGDVSSFFIGRFLGWEARETGLMARHRKTWDKAHRFFEKYGIFAIVAGRFVGFIRPVIPAVAGAAGMRRRVFIATDFASALAWAPAYLLPGYFGAEWVFGL